MGVTDACLSLSHAALSLQAASELFKQQQWQPSDPPSIALGRHIRPATSHEAQYLEISASRTGTPDADPAQASMHELLTVLKRERPEVAMDLLERWERVNSDFQTLYELCPEPNMQFVERSLKEKVEDCAKHFEAEIDLLEEQVRFLEDAVKTERAASNQDDLESQLELESIRDEIEKEKGLNNEVNLSHLKDEYLKLQNEFELAQLQGSNTDCQELAQLKIEVENAQSRLKEIKRDNSLQHKHVPNIRGAIRSLVQKRLEANEPFAIVLSTLHDCNNSMSLDEFKSKIGDIIKNRSDVVVLLYDLIGQGLIEIDRTTGKAVVKSCISIF